MRGTKVKKRIVSKIWMALAAAAVCMAVCFQGFSLHVHAEATGKITAKSANIRRSADKNSDVVASLVQGDTFTINGQTTGADGKIWYQVFVNSEQLGYIRSDLVEKTGDAPTITVSTSTTTNPSTGSTGSGTGTGTGTGTGSGTGTGAGGSAASPADDTVTAQVTRLNPVSATVKGASVNVRKNCTTRSSVVTSIPKGTVITINGQATGADGKIWYQVSFISNSAEVTGFIRSDYVTPSEEPTPYVEPEPTEPDPGPDPSEPDPVEPDPTPKEWEITQGEDATWKLTQSSTGKTYDIEQLLKLSAENAQKLKDANAALGSQKIVIIVLVVVLVILALVMAICIFKFKDVILEEAFGGREEPPARRRQPAGGRVSGSQSRPVGARPSGSQGQRPASSGQGQRPVSAGGQGQRPASSGQGQRPVSAGGQGQRPVSSGQGQRPVSAGSQGQRPVSSGQGQRPVSAGGQGQRPVSAGQGGTRPSGASRQGVEAISTAFDMTDLQQGEERVRRETARSLEEQQIRRNTPVGREGKNTRKSKNFMTDEDEFEYEFLNRDEEDDR